MKLYRVVWDSTAKESLKGITLYIKEESPSAAKKVRTELLKRNEKDDKKGQSVVEMPDCKDLVLAPEYNLKKKLLALDKAIQAQNPLPKTKRPSMVAPVNSHNSPLSPNGIGGEVNPAYARRYSEGREVDTDELDERQVFVVQRTEDHQRQPAQPQEQDRPKVIPIIPEKGTRADDIDLTAAIHLWNNGFDSERKLMKAFPGLTLYQAGLLRDRILEQAQDKVID